MQISGVAEKVGVKWESNAGKRFRSPLCSVLVAGTWYGFGFGEIDIAEGEVVSFEATQEGQYWNADRDSVQKHASDTPKAKVATQTADARQTSIVYQSQHRDAIEAVKFLVDTGTLSLGSKKADQYDIFLGLVNTLTVQWTKEALQPDLSEVEVSEGIGDE